MERPKIKWLAILGISAVIAAMSMSFIMLNTCLPSIQEAFKAEVVELQWIINLYGIVISSFLLLMGYLGDWLGYKKVYLLGATFLACSMLGSACAPNVGTIIGFQIFYGLAGAIILPVSQALLRNLFPEDQVGTAMGISMATGGIFFSIGPLLGGWIIHHLGWRWVFWVNFLMTLCGIAMTLFFVPSIPKQKGQNKMIDLKSSAVLIVSIAIFTLAIIQSNIWSLSTTIPLFITSLIGFSILGIWEWKTGTTIIQRNLFANRTFSLSSWSNFCMIGFLWSTFFLVPLFAQTILGYNAVKSGFLMFFYSIPIALLSPISGKIYNNIGPKLLLILGFVFLIIASTVQIFFNEGTSFYLVAVSIFVMGCGIGSISAPSAAAAISVLPKNETGLASGTFLTIQEIGGSVGLAVVATLVRFHSNFLQGYQRGMMLLSVISLLGLIGMFFLPKRAKNS